MGNSTSNGDTPRLGRPRAGDSAATRARILDVARRMFADLGYGATTNKALATEAGITTGALYHYFESKLDLYLAVHGHVDKVVYDHFQHAADAADTFIGKLEAVLDVAHELNRTDPALAQFLASVRVDARRHPELDQLVRPRIRSRASFYDNMVETGVRTGEIDLSDAQRVRALINVLLTGLSDAVSDNVPRHLRAVEAVKALIEGKLIRLLPETSPTG